MTEQDGLREQLAAAIKAEDVLRGFDTRGEWYARFADAALSVVAPVLEGLRAELERAEDESAQLRRQVVDERVQATRTSQELFAKWRGERDSERESRIAWALEADRLDQEQVALVKAVLGLTDQRAALSSVLRGMARRVSQKRKEIRELSALVPCGWCDGSGVAPEERFGHDADGAPKVDGDQPCPEGCRPSASDQTPATPDDTALTVAMSAARKVSILQRARIVMAMLDALAKAGLLAPTAVISDLRATAADLLTADDVTDHDRVAAQTLTDYADRLGKAAPSPVQGDTTPKAACVHGQTAAASHSYGAWRVGDHPGRDCELFIDTIDYVLKRRHAAQSAIQRNVHVGFAKAGRLLDLLETWGVVGPADGSAARKILVSSDQRSGIVAAIRKQATREAQS